MQTKTALVVDDSRVARLTLGRLLKTHDFDIIEQGSAEEAIAWLEQTSSRPDIIFMDVMMAGIDGLTATRQIKADPSLADVPVIICTGKETEADLEQALATGAAAVLSKPPAGEALQQLLADIETPETPPAEPAAPAAAINSDDLAEAIRARLMSEFEQKLSESVSALQQQIDRQQEQVASEKNQTGFDKLTEMSEQISGSVQQQISELKQSWSSQAEQVVSATAGKAVDSAMDNFGLSEKLIAILERQGRDWLNNQQTAIRETLQQELQQQISESLAQTLDQKLNEKLPPLIEIQQQAMRQDLAAEQKSQIDALKSQLAVQRNISIGAGMIAVIALILAVV